MPMLAVTWHSCAVEHERRGRRAASIFCGDRGHVRRRPRSSLDQHDELVAAEPRHRVAVAQALAQPLRHLPAAAVAGVVAQRVVDDLEAVEVDEQHRERARVALRLRERLVQALVEGAAVGQAG